MLIRAERSSDQAQISVVLSEAFRRPDSPDDLVPEVGLADALRDSPDWIPQQSLVAVIDDEVVGHCLCTRAHVGGAEVLALGPIGVVPGRQGRGVGTALMHEAIEIATVRGEPLIGLVGDYRYYERFGFVPASEVGIEAPEPAWGNYFQVRTLPRWDPSIRGRFVYAPPFQNLS